MRKGEKKSVRPRWKMEIYQYPPIVGHSARLSRDPSATPNTYSENYTVVVFVWVDQILPRIFIVYSELGSLLSRLPFW